MEYKFNPWVEKKHIVDWIKDFFATNGADKNAIVGISGGKDSTIVASFCAEALTPERVIGVIMPNGNMTEENMRDAKLVCESLGIKQLIVNIGDSVNALYDSVFNETNIEPREIYSVKTNLPARIRMTTLYTIASMYNGFVANTCNASEEYIGYSTKYGDGAGDFAPIYNYTVTELLAIGDIMELPRHLIHKAPSDDMCGRTDEDNFGFTYKELDDYITHNIIPKDVNVLANIKKLNRISNHKRHLIPCCKRYCYEEWSF